MEKVGAFDISPEEAWAWFSVRVILPPRQHMGFIAAWGSIALLYLGLLALNVTILQNSLWWALYYGVLAAGAAYLAFRNYQNYRIAKIRRDSVVPQWFKDMCLSYWVWMRAERSAARRQKLDKIRKGLGLDRRR